MRQQTKVAKTTMMGVGGILFFVAMAAAQSAATPPKPSKPAIPAKVDVVINEYAGARKIVTLPYALSANIGQGGRSSLRMGLRIPIAVGHNSFQYSDVGTDIDCWLSSLDDNRFRVHVSVSWSSLYSPPKSLPRQKEGSGTEADSSHPIFSHFSSDLNLIMRDGQTIESTVATDPISGHVTKVDVTLHVIKYE